MIMIISCIYHLEKFDIKIPEYRHAYDLICSKLEDIRKADKNKWHHRPIFRVSYNF